MPAIPVLGRLKQEDHEFKARVLYIVSPGQPELHSSVSKQKRPKNKEFSGRCIVLNSYTAHLTFAVVGIQTQGLTHDRQTLYL
jgi:hypothetical protein